MFITGWWKKGLWKADGHESLLLGKRSKYVSQRVCLANGLALGWFDQLEILTD